MEREEWQLQLNISEIEINKRGRKIERQREIEWEKKGRGIGKRDGRGK